MAKPRVTRKIPSPVARRAARRRPRAAGLIAARPIPVSVSAEYTPFEIEPRRLRRAVRDVLQGERAPCNQVSIAVVEGATMRRLNRQFLRHDFDTDVLTFCWTDEHAGDCDAECRHPREGEIVVSADFARRMAPRYGWRPADELLLYVVHGALHLAGYNDATRQQRAVMRARETHYLGNFGLEHKHGESSSRRSVMTTMNSSNNRQAQRGRQSKARPTKRRSPRSA